MRIAIYGAAGTGKTTLARMIEEELGVPFNPVGSRSVARAMGFDNPYDVDKHGRRAEFQRRLMTEKVAWEAEHESFVTDRTTFDNLVYTMFHDVGAVDAELFRAIVEGFKRYEWLLFCPMRAFWSVGDDPVRVQNKAYHQLFETVIEGLVCTHTVKSPLYAQSQFRIDSSTLHERREFVQKLKWARLP